MINNRTIIYIVKDADMWKLGKIRIPDMLIDPEIEKFGLEMASSFGRQLRKIMLDSGLTEEEINKILKEVRSNIRINDISGTGGI